MQTTRRADLGETPLHERIELAKRHAAERIDRVMRERRAADPRAWALMTPTERLADVATALKLPRDPFSREAGR